MKKLELGCGNNSRNIDGYENICVDMFASPHTNHIVKLGFEKLPLNNDDFDLVQAFDVFEHIPRVVFYPPTKIFDEFREHSLFYERIYPFIDMMNEIFRVLKHGGILYIETPGSEEAFLRDPTHINRLSDDWYHYFSQNDNLYAVQDLISTNFELLSQEYRRYKWSEKDIMCTKLRAVKQNSSSEVLI